MSKKTTFYHLQSSTMAPCSIDKDAYAQARKTWLCEGCCTPKPEQREIDCRIQETRPTDEPLNFVNGCGVPLVCKRFLSELGDDVAMRDLYLGCLYGPDGQPIEDWLTFRGRRRIIVRGSRNVSYRKCSECGRSVYFAMGKRYLYPEPPHDVSIFESDLFGLVLPESVFGRVRFHKWENVTIDRLEVLDFPQDSLDDIV